MPHTPKPWIAVHQPTLHHTTIHGAEVSNLPVALVWQRDDAYLIEAAPDLRRFAQEIAALDPQDFDAHMGEALIRRARALVVKADGAT